MGYIDIGKRQGARMLCGGGRPDSLKAGFYVQPTVFVDVKPSMAIWNEEIFGPVLSVMEFGDEEEAVTRANASEFGLGAGCRVRAREFLRRRAAAAAGCAQRRRCSPRTSSAARACPAPSRLASCGTTARSPRSATCRGARGCGGPRHARAAAYGALPQGRHTQVRHRARPGRVRASQLPAAEAGDVMMGCGWCGMSRDGVAVAQITKRINPNPLGWYFSKL